MVYSPVFTEWLDKDTFENRTEYFFNAVNRLETEFINYLEYVPLRTENLKVSSQRLADFMLRIFPLMTIGFNIITFGDGMKQYVNSANHIFSDSTIQQELFSKLVTLHNENNPFLRDYYNLHLDRLFQQYWNISIEEDDLELRKMVGIINYSTKIVPFDHSIWDQTHKVRNEIIHRTRTEASLENVVNGLGCLNLIAGRICNWTRLRYDYRSVLFNIEHNALRWV